MAFSGILDLVFPRFCLSCGQGLLATRRRWLCTACLARIAPLTADPCPVCAGALGPGAVPSSCPDCRRLRPRFEGAVAVGRYEDLLRELATRFKYGPEPSLAWPLGELLAETLEIWPRLPEIDALVPVPLRPYRRLRRGFNQAELLAAEVSRRLGLPLLRRTLVRGRFAPAQAGLARSVRLLAQRRTMLARSVGAALRPAVDRLPALLRPPIRRALPDGLRGRCLLVVDDVLTTGATANEAARALLDAGARRVLVAAVARA